MTISFGNLYCNVQALSSSSSSFTFINHNESNGVVRIGTRPSPLALYQTDAFAKRLTRHLKDKNINIQLDIVEIDSKSEEKFVPERLEQPLAKCNADFTGTLDDALLNGFIDIGIHSLKDIPPDDRWDHESLSIACHLPRACPYDVLIGRTGDQREERTHTRSLLDLPLNACIGSSSLRRQSQLLALRPDLQFINIRGNVQTRMNALKAKDDNSIHIDAIILAQAGLERLGIMGKNSFHSDEYYFSTISPEQMLPTPAQGIIAAVCRTTTSKDLDLQHLLADMNDCETQIAAVVERSCLNVLDSSSPWKGRPPLAALMMRSLKNQNEWIFRTCLSNQNGTKQIKVQQIMEHSNFLINGNDAAEKFGVSVGQEIVTKMGADFFYTQSSVE